MILHLHSQNQQCRETPLLPDLYPQVNTGSLHPITELTKFMIFTLQGLLSCEDHYREALRLRPHYVAAWENLGLVLLNTSKNL